MSEKQQFDDYLEVFRNGRDENIIEIEKNKNDDYIEIRPVDENSTYRMLCFSIDNFNKIKHLIEKCGIYFLCDYFDELHPPRQIYIGESDDIAIRGVDHKNNPKKDWVKKVIVFITETNTFTKDKALAFEAITITHFKQQDIYIMDQQNENLPNLNNKDKKSILRAIPFIRDGLHALGFNILNKQKDDLEYRINKEDNVYICKVPGNDKIIAYAQDLDLPDKYIRVFKGSKAVLQLRNPNSFTFKNDLAKLRANGTIVEENGAYVFKKDVDISSSCAVQIVRGGDKTGPKYWINKKTGKSLQEDRIQAELKQEKKLCM